jgi:hypothetical protein
MRADYEMLIDFWSDVVGPREGRRLLVATAFDGDFWLRDGYAWGLVREKLHGRDDVEFTYVNPAIVADPAPPAGRDVLFIGRPKLFTQSALSPLAARLAVRARGQFLDYPSGAPGDSIRYDGHVFTRRELEAWPDHYKRTDRDYAVFLNATEMVAGEVRRLVSFSGIGALGTLCLLLLLSNLKHRQKIVEEISALLPWTPSLTPRDFMEVCVSVSVNGDAALRNFLNVPNPTFGVEAVMVQGADAPCFRMEKARLQLIPGEHGGGSVVIDGAAEPLDLGASRFALLRWLVEKPDLTRTEHLFEPLRIASPANDVAKRAASVRVAKTVHDLNVLFQAFPAFRDRSAIESRKQRYVLNAEATIAAARAA